VYDKYLNHLVSKKTIIAIEIKKKAKMQTLFG